MDEQASAVLSPGRFVAAGLISACGDDKPGYCALRLHQARVDFRNARREIFRHHAGPGGGGSLAMHPYGSACGLERRHALGEEAGGEPGQHVAGARGREPGRCIGIDGGAAVGRRDHGVGAFEDDHRAGPARGGAGEARLGAVARTPNI